MLNWFMELNSLKNLSRCEKGSGFKSSHSPSWEAKPKGAMGHQFQAAARLL